MKKEILIITLLLFISSVIIFLTVNVYSSPPREELEECKTIYYNGEGRINILVFAKEKYAKRYADYFLKISPFKENKELFNFFYIDDYTPQCEIYKDKALLCYNKEIIKKSSACPNDYIITIKEEPSRIRSSAYTNVISINLNHPLVVLPHEFGHSFANLADEYVPAKLPDNSKNCVASCGEFNTEECFQGCSKSDFFRSIDHGIMRTLYSDTYGEFDQSLVNEQIKKQTNQITGQAIANIPDCSKEKYYLISGEYSDGKITINNKKTETGCINKNNIGTFTYSLSSKNKVLSNSFNPELIFTDAPKENNQIDGEVLEYKGEFFLKIPLIPEAEFLEIKKDSEVLTKINLNKINSIPCK